MSWIVAGAAAVTIGSTIGSMWAGGKGAQTEKEKQKQLVYAGDLYQEQLGLLGEEKELALGAAGSQYAGGVADVSMGTQTGMRGVQQSSATAASKSGMATSGTIEQQTRLQTGDLMAKYKSDMTKLFETRDLSRTQADLSYRKGEMSAEEAYEAQKTQIEAQPTGFWEGVFS